MCYHRTCIIIISTTKLIHVVLQKAESAAKRCTNCQVYRVVCLSDSVSKVVEEARTGHRGNFHFIHSRDGR